MPANTPPGSTSASPATPQQIGHYQLVAKIGAGGMGEVYRARDPRLNRDVLEPLNLLWLEEPCPAENMDAMADIRHSTSTPIACGENLYMRWAFRELLQKGAADILQPDLQKVGGLAEAQTIAKMAHSSYLPLAPHCVVSPIGAMATCHACASFPNFLACEWHWINFPDYWRNWVKEGQIIEKGFITLPERPGIGVEMDQAAAKKARIPGTPWFEAGQ